MGQSIAWPEEGWFTSRCAERMGGMIVPLMMKCTTPSQNNNSIYTSEGTTMKLCSICLSGSSSERCTFSFSSFLPPPFKYARMPKWDWPPSTLGLISAPLMGFLLPLLPPWVAIVMQVWLPWVLFFQTAVKLPSSFLLWPSLNSFTNETKNTESDLIFPRNMWHPM